MGRSQELINLHRLLQQGDRLAITAATGMGGIGKTDLAWHYAEQHRADYAAGIWWIGVDQLVVKVLEYARRMGLPDPREEDSEAAKVQWCYQKWGEQCPDGVRLIIWDDVGDAKAYRNLQDYLPPDARFRLLITTRAKLGHPVQRLELDVLSRSAAFRLLRQLVEDDRRIAAEVETAKALCDWVGRLPLGIELVGRHLAIHRNLTLATLLERLETQKLNARALHRVPAEMPYRDSIAAAFELSWQTLSDPAKQIGSLLSLFALAPIPKALIASCGEGDEEDLEDCLDLELVNRSLLSGLNNGSYLLHSLTREFFATKLERSTPEADRLRQGFAVAMTAVAKTIPQTVTLGLIATVKEAMPHLEAAAAYTGLLSDEDCYWPQIGAARFYQGQSLWQEAEHWYQACREMTVDRFGSDHPSTAMSLNNLAALYESQGRYSEAEPLHLQALDIRRSQLGQDHPDTAQSLNNLALLYESQGRYSEAEPLYLQALDIHRSQLGTRPSLHRHESEQFGRVVQVARALQRGRTVLSPSPRHQAIAIRTRPSLHCHESEQFGSVVRVARALQRGRTALSPSPRHQAIAIRTRPSLHHHESEQFGRVVQVARALQRGRTALSPSPRHQAIAIRTRPSRHRHESEQFGIVVPVARALQRGRTALSPSPRHQAIAIRTRPSLHRHQSMEFRNVVLLYAAI